MEAVVAIIAAGLGAMWWQRRRWTRAHHAFLDRLDPDAAVALHVAQHEARTRHHATLSGMHLLYGALQIEMLADAIRATSGDVEALEDRVLRALDGHTDDERILTDDAQRVLSHLHAVAVYHQRRATPTDLWSSLLRCGAAALLEGGDEAATTGRIDGRAVLFALVHHASEPEVARTGPDVFIVLRNDDHTPFEFVTHALTDVFGTTEDQARAIATQVHTEGRGVVCRATPDDAHDRIARVRGRAVEHGFPLWIATEPT